MTVQELIQALEQFDPSTEVRMAQQPNYPLQMGVYGVAVGTDDTTETEVAFVLEGSSKGYASRDLWDRVV